MAYDLDLRERVLGFISEGNSMAKAARLFRVGRSTIYAWQKRETLAPGKPGPRKPRTLCYEALKDHIEAYPDAYQHERAKALGVSRHVVLYGLKRLKLSRKKNDALPRKKRQLSHGIPEEHC